jgi:hypothetical protein
VILALAALSIAALPLVALAQSSQPSASGQAAPEKSAPAQATPTQAAPATAAQATPAKSAPTASTSKSGMSSSAKKDEVQRQLKMMADQLKLTPDQRDKCKAILTDNAAQLKQIHAKYTGMEKNDANKAAMKKDMTDLRDASDAKMAEVLSADQMTQYKAMREAHMAKMKQNMAGREHKEGEDDHK